MDKNTITGMLLIIAVLFCFTWLTPKKSPAADDDLEETAQTEMRAPSTPDSLSATEKEWLIRNIADNGEDVTLADGRHAMRLNYGAISLTTVGDSVTGNVTIDGKTLDWHDVLAADLTKMNIPEQRRAIEMVRNASTAMGRYGKFARFLAGNDTTLTLSNDVITLSLDSKSGSITRAELLDYYTEYTPDESAKRKDKVVVFEGKTNSFDFQLPLPNPVGTSDLYFEASMPNDTTVLMTLPLGKDAYWGLEYTLPKGKSYVVGIRVVQKNLAGVIESNNRNMTVAWHQDLIRQEKGKMFEERNSALYYKYAGGNVENLSENKNASEDRRAKVRWIGYKNQFFSSVLIADRPFNTADFQSRVLKNDPWLLKSFDSQAQVNDYDWNSPNPASFSLFIGPNLYPLLSHLDTQTVAGDDLSLTRLIPLGWSIFRWINTGVVIPLFTFLGSFLSNYGIIILIMTLLIKLVLFPLTYKSYMNQAKMRLLAPDIKAINERYPGQDNAMLRQQKTMELYNKAGSNPMSGCIPMLLQMPILFAMFSFFPSAIELRGESFLWAKNLAAPDAIISWSGNIPLVTEYFGNHISLFCLLMTVTNIVYTRLNMQSNSSQMPGMQWMMYLMPVFFMIFFNNYAAGLSYYYFLSLLISIAQTYAFRFFVSEEKLRKTMAENAKKPRKQSKWAARLEEMQRQQQAMLKERQRQQQRGRR